MKLPLTIAVALVALGYAIAKFYNPNFPFTPDELLRTLVFLLSLFGVIVGDEQVRAFMVKRGFKGFMRTK